MSLVKRLRVTVIKSGQPKGRAGVVEEAENIGGAVLSHLTSLSPVEAQ